MVERSTAVKEWTDKDYIAMMEDEEENDIMNRLDYLKLETIYNDYDILGGSEGLELNEFIAVMTQEQHLGVKKESKEAHIQMVRNLIDLFRQIDVNNDKTLEWVEFTNHIIELGMVRQDKVFIDSIKNYHPSDIKDSKHDTEIDNIFYLPKLQHLLVMERDAKKFKVYDTKTGKYMQTVPEKATDNGVIIAADYIEKGNTKLVATTTNNLQICFWDSNNYIWRNRINCAEIQLCMKWCGGNVNKLFTGGVDKIVHAWDVEKYSEISHESTTKTETDLMSYHSGEIQDLLPIPDLGLLASAGLDNKICLWRMDNMQPNKPLMGHNKGVYSLDWYKDNNLILSAGFDHDVFIWNPHVTKRIFQLKGHNHSLAGVKWLPGTNQIISADISGMFKVWDVRTFSTIQSFNCPLNEINCLAVTQPPKRIIAGGRRLVFFDYNEPTGYNLADDEACLSVLYNPVFYTFITAHPKCIKVWDASNGSLQSVFRDITKSEITCICMDERMRKLFVGDQKGRTRSINIKNGQKIKSFKKEKKLKNRELEVISGLRYWGVGSQENSESVIKNQLIVTSWDGRLFFFDDDDANSRVGAQRGCKETHLTQINSLDFKMVPNTSPNSNVEQGIIATADDHGYIYIYNHSSHRPENTLQIVNENIPSVKIVKFILNTDCVVSADMAGYLNFWAMNPHPHKGKRLAFVINQNNQEKIDRGHGPELNLLNFAIRGIDYDPENHMLYTGDESGYMQKWDISVLLEKMEATMKTYQTDKTSMFITNPNPKGDAITFDNSDVRLVHSWQAHKNQINCITWVPQLSLVTSCSYDCNVFMWNSKGEKIGSLVLGNKATAPDQIPDPETARYRRGWKIEIDKVTHYKEELKEAEDIWSEVSQLNYKQMKADALAKKRKLDAINNQGKKQAEIEKAAQPQLEDIKHLREAQQAIKQRKVNQYEMLTENEKDSHILRDL